MPLNDEAATLRLGDALALALRPGDMIALSGDLGAGKTTLARAILRAFCGIPDLEVPSPTFTLTQSYEGERFRFPIIHADLYRVKGEGELDELGLDDALLDGALLVEWPEHAGARLPAARFEVAMRVTGEKREARLSATTAALAMRLRRMAELRRFIDDTPYAAARRHFLQGDASPRAYERLAGEGHPPVILLNADAQPDRPVSAERRAYMETTHLAPNENIAPLLAIGAALNRAGLSVAKVHAASLERAVAVFEDLGTDYVQIGGRPVPERYAAALDALAHLHRQSMPLVAEGPFGARHALPFYSRGAMETEAALCIEKFIPAITGGATAPDVAAAFRAAWDGPFGFLECQSRVWTIFDYHSPNLHWLDGREGLERVGIIDLQDARLGPAAYDVVSLTQDARVTVPATLENELVKRYLAAMANRDGFDETAFAASYAICGAQRSTRILGVFARLATQDAKPHYLRHIPRVSDYLDRCLVHPALAEVRRWFDLHAPSEQRLRLANGK